jgi:hypothetical protein
MFGFAILAILYNLIAGLLLLFCLTVIVNFITHRSFKFQTAPNLECFGSFFGALLATGILGTLWNLKWGANAGRDWYDLFIHMSIYGSLLGGLLGKSVGEKLLAKVKLSLSSRRWLTAIAIVFALAALYSYIYTGGISYGDS